MKEHGFARITVASPLCAVGNPEKNAEYALQVLDSVRDSDVVVFPELNITGYTCADLFRQQLLLDEAEDAVAKIVSELGNRRSRQLVFVGAPIPVGGQLYNCAIAIHNGDVIGIVPKQNIPTYNEFYESRWFRAGCGEEPKTINYVQNDVPFGIDLLFNNESGLVVYAEICEDVWMPIPPSSYAAIMGANVLVNLSASNETVAKCAYRTDLVANQSGRCVAAYAYASAGPTESTTDLVFGGHCLIAENSHVIAESDRVGDGNGLIREPKWATADVDVEKLMTERRLLSSFGESRRLISKQYRTLFFEPLSKEQPGLLRKVNGTPFVPKDQTTLNNRCAEITGIQVAALAKRIEGIPSKKSYIGVSGGLDSTLALLVAVEAYRGLGLPPDQITGLTMPGFGTTSRTKNNAIHLMELLGIQQKTIDIRQMCLETFISMGHKPFGIDLVDTVESEICKQKIYYTPDQLSDLLQNLTPEQVQAGDLVFENVQARIRTMLLMSYGFVLGTGDLSELALGWCTYNGDHMSMYNVNCSIPKTLVKFLVDYYAEHRVNRVNGNPIDERSGIPDPTNQLYHTLKDIVATTISPELLPHSGDQIVQSTEDNIGPYELHDFFLLNFVRNGFSPEKILYLSGFAEFSKEYDVEFRTKILRVFLKRFFSQQFKRSCVPDGPKVGSVSLSPRGDWRMPSDADVEMWLK
jgi:NAD+ synthase (glutamine-hydrolysing)